MTDQDKLRRVLAQIHAMRQNLSPEPDERDAERFQEQLDCLDQAGYNVDEFRLDTERDMFYQNRRRTNRLGQQVNGAVGTIRQGILESRMDAILSYFQLVERNKPIGFNAPRK